MRCARYRHAQPDLPGPLGAARLCCRFQSGFAPYELERLLSVTKLEVDRTIAVAPELLARCAFVREREPYFGA